MGILEDNLPAIVAEEIQRALAPFVAGMKRFRRLVEEAEDAGLGASPVALPETESPAEPPAPKPPRKKRVARRAAPAPAPKAKAAKSRPAVAAADTSFSVGDEVTFKRGRGTYAGTIVGTDKSTGALRVKRTLDGVEVVRSADLLTKAATKPGRKKTAAPAPKRAAKKEEAAPKAKPAAVSKPGPKANKSQKKPKKTESPQPTRKRGAHASPAAAPEPEPAVEAEAAETITVSEGQHVLFEHNGGAHKGKVKTVHYATGLLDIVRSDGSEISKKASQVQPTEE